MTTINAAELVTLTEKRPKTPPPLVTTPIGKSWEGAPNTNREARRLGNEVRAWAQKFDAPDARALAAAMDDMERLVVRVWTEIDESLLCLSLAESSNHPERATKLRTTAIGYLKRWLNGCPMANGRNKLRRGDAGRDAGGFVALPWVVLDSPAYSRLSMHARALLLEVARQFTRDNNGWMLLSRAYMAGRGWKSCDMLDKAKRELLAAGFIFETVKGQRPNKAARYAVTWRALDRHPGYDVGSMEGFQRGAYRLCAPGECHAQIAPPVPPHGTEKNACLVPPHGHIDRPIGPPHGTERAATVPPHGPMRGVFGVPPVPPHGHHLENHLPASAAKDVQAVEGVQETRANIGQDGDSAGRKREAAPRPPTGKSRSGWR